MFKKIEKRLVLDSLSRHKDVMSDFLKQIERMPKEILENIGTDLAKKAVRMSQEVDSDLHAHKAFLRLSVSPHGILYAKSCKMKHYNEELLLKFFQTRFPTLIVMFESHRGVFMIDHNQNLVTTDIPLEKILAQLEEKLAVNPLLNGLNEKNYEELWKGFARSQIIQGRETLKQLENLSKRWKNTVAEDNSKVKKLDDFL
ncbi:MAG: DUF4130 domain-containing protein [Candidatus Hodarchaeota archaeon]